MSESAMDSDTSFQNGRWIRTSVSESAMDSDTSGGDSGDINMKSFHGMARPKISKVNVLSDLNVVVWMS